MTGEDGMGGTSCPACGRPGRSVAWRTAAAVSTVSLPARQELFLCRTAGCDLLYFGSSGARVGCADLARRPWFKQGGDVVCFCFVVRRAELEAPGGESLPATVEARVRRGDCACDVRNPSGKCCLADLAALAVG